MKFCPAHWGRLCDAVKASGLNALIPETAESTLHNMVDQIQSGVTLDNFDPLMGAHNAVVAAAMNILGERYGASPLVLFVKDEDKPDELDCPICALNWYHAEHDRTCTRGEACRWPRGLDWSDDLIGGAVKATVNRWKELRP